LQKPLHKSSKNRILAIKKIKIMNATIKKAELVKTLFQIEEAELLDEVMLSIEQTILKYKRSAKAKNGIKTPKSELEKLHELARQPTPKHIPLEVLAKEQGYSSEKFKKALDDIDHSLYEDETLEEMLNTLTK
jgi:peptidyl-tRNA hydrolase